MKIRNGFVSNSSSSSFVCGLCGTVEAGYEASASDFDMSTCEHGHEWHNDCVYTVKELSWTKDEFYETSIKFLNRYIECNKVDIGKWSQKTDEYYKRAIQRAEEQNVDYKNSIAQLEKIYKEQTEGEFLKEGQEIIQVLLDDLDGYPEEFCPVCRLEKIYEQDPEWPKYMELKKKFRNLHTM